MSNNIKLENEFIFVDIDISHGGKPVKIIDKKNNINWVWYNSDQQKYFKPRKYSDYDTQWIGGYEELYPNDKVEIIGGRESPDHGELWSSNWKIINQSTEYLEISTRGYFSKTLVNKKFKLVRNKLNVSYDLSEINLEKFLFKLHLALPIDNNKIDFIFDRFKKVDNNFGNIVSSKNLNNFLSSINENQDSNDFVYFYGVDGKVYIQDQNENELKLTYDKETLPYFWIFQSRGGWNKLNVNVLEPCNSGLKDIEDAYEQNKLYLPQSDRYKTWYTIEVR
mgnify:FL=1|tara:strand:- start:747 stop:1583 length:837 start_codon:yes stop_codon:yes gene_type:complete